MDPKQTNALDILLQALPSTDANSLAKQLSVTIQPPTTNTFTSLPTTTATTTSSETTGATATAITAQSTASISATSVPAAAQGLSPGAIAGITAGSIVGVIIIIIILLYFLRFRKQSAHRRNPSQTSLLGSISDSVKRKKKQPKVFPEVAWLYDPVRPASRDVSVRASNESGPQMHANAPWDSRPSMQGSTGGQIDRTMTALPSPPPKINLPGIPTARAINPAFLEEGQAGQPRRYSYPLRPTVTEEETPVELISPLLPPPPPAVTHGQSPVNAFAHEYQQEIGNFPSRQTTRGHNTSPMTATRPLTRHGGANPF